MKYHHQSKNQSGVNNQVVYQTFQCEKNTHTGGNGVVPVNNPYCLNTSVGFGPNMKNISTNNHNTSSLISSNK